MNQLQDLLNHYSEFRILSKKDNDKIMRFFNQTSMETTSLKLRYERTPDFFTFLDYQSDEVFVMGGDKDEKDIKAIATMTIRDGFINGQLKRVAYLGDLRVKGGIRYSMRWQQLFGDILENSKRLEDVNVDYFITAVMGGNAKASKALVENKKSKFKYQKLCDYKMVNVVMPYKKLASIRGVEIRWATVDDKEELLDFLEYKNKNRPFGFTREYIERAFDKWTHFSIENFIILKKSSRIVSTCAIWNPSPAKKIIIESLPRSLKILNILVSLFTKTSKVGEELKVQYLNFLNLGHKDDLKIIFEFLRLEKIFKQYDLIAFADFEPFNYREGLKGHIMDLTPLELYRVKLRESNETSKVCWTKPPAFEISLV
jgi:hypothetical protein